MERGGPVGYVYSTGGHLGNLHVPAAQEALALLFSDKPAIDKEKWVLLKEPITPNPEDCSNGLLGHPRPPVRGRDLTMLMACFPVVDPVTSHTTCWAWRVPVVDRSAVARLWPSI